MDHPPGGAATNPSHRIHRGSPGLGTLAMVGDRSHGFTTNILKAKKPKPIHPLRRPSRGPLNGTQALWRARV